MDDKKMFQAKVHSWVKKAAVFCTATFATAAHADLIPNQQLSTITGFDVLKIKPDSPPVKKRTTPMKTPDEIMQEAVFFIDLNTSLIFGHDLDPDDFTAEVDPASLLKLATATVVNEYLKKKRNLNGDPLDLDTKLETFKINKGKHKGTYYVPSTYNVEDGLKYAIRQSHNTMASGLGATIAGSPQKFRVLLNQKLEQWGLYDTYAINATGLPGRDHKDAFYPQNKGVSNVTTYQDLARMLIKFHHSFDGHEKYSSLDVKNISNGEAAAATNPIFKKSKWKKIAGEFNMRSKTGYTNAAGYSLASIVEVRGRDVGIIVYGAETREESGKQTINALKDVQQFYDSIQNASSQPATNIASAAP